MTKITRLKLKTAHPNGATIVRIIEKDNDVTYLIQFADIDTTTTFLLLKYHILCDCCGPENLHLRQGSSEKLEKILQAFGAEPNAEFAEKNI